MLFLGLLERVALDLPDDRDPKRITHSTLSLLRQRVYGIAQGYEDLNDHDVLRHDPLLQTALGQLHSAGSSPTLCRFENRENRAAAMVIAHELVEQFIASFTVPPKELILDFDATDDPIHGNQAGRFFTVIMAITVFYRCMYFAAHNCWSPIFVPAISTQPNTVQPFSNCW